MAISTTEFLKRFETGITNAGEKYTSGIDSGKSWEAGYTDPSAQANMEAGLRKAIAEGRPVEGARKIGDAGFKAAAKSKVGNYTGAARRAAQNIAPYAPKILAAADAARAAAANVTGPKNRQTAKNKMMAAIDAIMDTWGKE